MNVRASRYNHVREIGGDLWGFQARTGALVRFNASTAALLQSATRNSVPLTQESEELLRAGFFIPEQSDEVMMLRLHAYSRRYQTHNLSLVIAPTMDCNMKCSYCFENASPDYMTPEVSTGIYKLIADHASKFKYLTIAWYGGEPLLSLETIINSMSEFKKLATKAGAKCTSMIMTNGTLLTAETASKLCKAGVTRAQVTLDGTADNHDQHRIDTNGNGTWHTIVDNITTVSTETDLKIVIRATLSHDKISKAFDLAQRLDDRGVPDAVRIVPAPIDPNRACSDSCRPNTHFNRSLYEQVLSRGCMPCRLDFQYPRMSPACMAVKSQSFLVDPTGDIHRCLETAGESSLATGNVLSDPMQDHRFLTWQQTDVFNESECVNCKWLPLCFGGCPLYLKRTGQRSCTPMKGNLELWMDMQAVLHKSRQVAMHS